MREQDGRAEHVLRKHTTIHCHTRNQKKLEFIMNNQPQIPEAEIREASLKKMREVSLMFDAQIMLLDELIAQVEAQNHQSKNRLYRQKESSLNIEH